MDVLKRIEEKHPSIAKRDGSAGFFCKRCAEDHPCNELKLARALENLLDTYGPMRPLSGTTWAKAKRTLEKVAGEPMGKVEE